MYDAWGIAEGHYDIDGEWIPTDPAVRDVLREAMGTPEPGPSPWFVPHGSVQPLWNACHVELEDGGRWEHLLALPADLPMGYHRLVPADGAPPTDLIVHPAQCPPLPRAWGVAVQTYALWSDASWGVGDLGDLRTLCASVAAAGGGAVLISPLHQPALSHPVEPSPYYPSSRRAWNPLLVAMDEPPPDDLRCDGRHLIERDRAWDAKRLRLHATYTELHDDVRRAIEPDDVAWWNARCEVHGPDPTVWPPAADDPEGDRVADVARFHQWMQGLVGAQLDAVRATGVHLIGDLAIGFSPGGADAAAYRHVLAPDLRLGAPPDPFNEDGQDWGIPPFVPWKLRREGFRPFIHTVRAVLRGVDGLRIDHVMGLFRQYLIPAGGSPTQGAYVQFPADELLAILRLEAVRAGVFVIGEDLGTVEAGVREALAASRIAGTRVLWFEEQPPSTWPAANLATVTTHDLPTIASVFDGDDGTDEMRERLEVVAPAALRARDAIEAAHEALLASPPDVRLLAADDLCGARRRPNMPGRVHYPSWRIPLPVPVDELHLPDPRC